MTSNYYDIHQERENPLAQFQGRLLNVTWTQYSREWNSTMHTHRHAELFFIISGQGSFQLMGQTFPVAGRDLVVINPGTPHRELSQSGSPLVYIGVLGGRVEVLAGD